MEQAQADDSGHDQVECDDVIEQPWHHQDEDPCNQGDDRLVVFPILPKGGEVAKLIR